LARPDSIGILVPVDPGQRPAPPEDLPLGRAALLLSAEGLDLVFGEALHAGPDGWARIDGMRARPGRWEPAAAVPIRALHDRYPSQGRAAGFQRALLGLGRTPIGNPPSLTALFRDKLACQRALEAAGVDLPPVEDDPAAFNERLCDWGFAFLKPRFGAHGAGVRRVVPGDELDALVVGLDPSRPEPALLQRALLPPVGWAGWSVRVLCQRKPDGGWWVDAGAARRSRTDPVVNAARGAEVLPLPDLLPAGGQAAVSSTVDGVLAALASLPSAELLVEVGLDLVIDDAGRPWLIEVNGRPSGRLLAVASATPDGWDQHVAACARPIRALAAMA
jgi:hypothetical protein